MGWAFKANTNDSRESAAIYVAEKLYKAGATIEIYDPMVSEQTVLNDIRLYWKLKISTNYKKINILKSIDSSDDYQAFVVLTEWDVFRNLNLDYNKSFDGRRILTNTIYKIGNN